MSLTEDKPRLKTEPHPAEERRAEVKPASEPRIIEARTQDQSSPIQTAQASEGPRWRRRRWLIVLIALVIIGAIIGGTMWWIESSKWVSTDDAFIDTHTIQVSAQVAGRVKTVL